MMLPVDLEKIVAEHQAGLWCYASSLGADQHTADDLVQETFLICSLKWDTIRNPFRPGAVRAWLKTVLRNEYLALRRRRRETLLDQNSNEDDSGSIEFVDPKGLTPQDILQIVERDGALRSALAQLPDEDRALLELSVVEGLTVEEIAEMRDVTVATIRAQLHRVKMRLRDILLGREREEETNDSDLQPTGRLLGSHPEDGQPVRLFLVDGRKNDYLIHNRRKVHIPRRESRNDAVPLTLERAVQLLEEDPIKKGKQRAQEEQQRRRKGDQPT